MRLGLFVLVVAGLAVAAFVLKGLPFAPDAFATRDGTRLARLAQLDEHATAELKIQHALSQAPVELGLFGNSRIAQVSAEDVGAPARRFFNFAVPGSSLRQSVALLEALAAEGRAPSTAVVSLDHLELSFYSPAQWPVGPQAWFQAAADLRWTFDQDGVGLAARAAHDHARQMGRRVAEALSFARLAARLGFLAPDYVPALREFDLRFKPDGSRPMPDAAAAADEPAPRPAAFVLHRPYLLRDLQRLAAVQRAGVRVLIYESPLSPSNRREIREAPRAAVEKLRRDWLQACRDLGLVCLPAPELGGGGRPPFWPDCCHAPAELLGPFIAGALKDASAG